MLARRAIIGSLHQIGLRSLAPPLIQRQFSTGPIAMGPYRVYNNSRISRVLRYVPQPIKTFGSIVLGTAVTLLLAPGLILLLGPPLIVGSFFLWRRVKKLKAQLYDKRWEDMASYHLTRQENGRVNNTIPYEARSRIFDALAKNEQHLQEIFCDPMTQDIAFTELEGLSQDFKADYGGISTNMQIETYGLIIEGRRAATVSLVEKGNKTRIEIEPRGRRGMIVLSGTADMGDGIIIDVKKKN